MPRRTSLADSGSAAGAGTVGLTVAQAPIATAPRMPIRVVLVTMDTHLAGAAQRAQRTLLQRLPSLAFTVHAAAQWHEDSGALERCRNDIASADIVIVTMLFMEEHFLPVLPALMARRDACDAMVCAMSASEVMRLTRMGRFRMDGSTSGGLVGLLKRLRGSKPGPSHNADGTQNHSGATAGAQQMKMLRRLPKLLRYIPGTAQDVRAYFLCLQFWLAGSERNVANLVLSLIDRYADGPRRALRGRLSPEAPAEYPEVGIYHPQLGGRLGAVAVHERISERLQDLPRVASSGKRGCVGLLLMRSYLLAGNTGHYDGVIAALEARGLRVLPIFATGLDARPAIERYCLKDGKPVIDALVSLTGFSLVGGPAYNDARAAEELLARLDVPYLVTTPVEFQTLEQWQASERGLLPVEATMMVALPELDGATGPMVIGGRSSNAPSLRNAAAASADDMVVNSERADALAARVGRLVDLRVKRRAERKLAVVLFNFPPNAGNTGTAAFLAVFESLYNLLVELKRGGYRVELPASADALREAITVGNAERYGAAANVAVRIAANDHVRRERWLGEIEAHWGPAPGRAQSDGGSIFVLGAHFGEVFVGIQPGLGSEGDPMRLLFDKGYAPTHAFSAFYRWLREDFAADAVLHFGTHGALEFMPGKQVGLSGSCWPERLIGDLPNVYLYASNNPSEGALAKRRAAATLVSYLTPPLAEAGLYRGLVDLKASISRWRSLPPEAGGERCAMQPLVQAQAAALDLTPAEPPWTTAFADREVQRLADAVLELEYTLIPHGLHVLGRIPSVSERVELLLALADASHGVRPAREALDALLRGASLDEVMRLQARMTAATTATTANTSVDTWRAVFSELAAHDRLLAEDHEIPGVLHALDGGYVRPAPGGDLLRTPAVLPTGRNLHGFDPFRLPSAYAVQDGSAQAERLLARHRADGHAFPESIALVLWGCDTLKTEGAPIAQALALIGAKPRFDSYGRLAGAELLPLAELKRPRIDVMVTLSGIFRDLLPLQIKLLAEAALLAASADEPTDLNFVRKHALAYQAEHGGDLETAALRVFGNAEGAYGANVNQLLDSSRWDDEDELAETYTRRKGFAYGRNGRPVKHDALLQSVLSGISLAYQNLESVELGVTTVDTYFDTLGGISRAVQRAKSANRGASGGVDAAATAPVYIGDQTTGSRDGGTVRTLSEQVALETRTRMLNPKWYEGLLAHGYEGVRQIEAHVTNTMGWSATTGQVQPWVYQQLTQTFMLDAAMRDRMARLNPSASAKLANRLLEASQRNYWKPDASMLEALRQAGEELEDRLEGIFVERAPA